MADEQTQDRITIGTTHRLIEMPMRPEKRARINEAMHSVMDQNYKVIAAKKEASRLLGEQKKKTDLEIERLHLLHKHGKENVNVACQVIVDVRRAEVITVRCDTGAQMGDPRPLNAAEREQLNRFKSPTLPGMESAEDKPKLDLPELTPDEDDEEGKGEDLDVILARSTLDLTALTKSLEKVAAAAGKHANRDDDEDDEDEGEADAAEDEAKSRGKRGKRKKGKDKPNLAAVPQPQPESPPQPSAGPFKEQFAEGEEEKPGFQASQDNPWNTEDQAIPIPALEVTGDLETVDMAEAHKLLKTGVGGTGTLATGHPYTLTLIPPVEAEGRNPKMIAEGERTIGMVLGARPTAPELPAEPEVVTEQGQEEGDEDGGAATAEDEEGLPVDASAEVVEGDDASGVEEGSENAVVEGVAEDTLAAGRLALAKMPEGLRDETKDMIEGMIRDAENGIYPVDFEPTLATAAAMDEVPEQVRAVLPAIVADLIAADKVRTVATPLDARSGGPLHYHASRPCPSGGGGKNGAPSGAAITQTKGGRGRRAPTTTRTLQ